MGLGPGTDWHRGIVSMCQGPCPEGGLLSRCLQMASGRLLQGTPRWGVCKSGEARRSGWGCGVLRVIWEPVSSLQLVCPSGRQNSSHPERSPCPAGTGPLACPMHVAAGVREGSEREVLIYLTASPLWRRQAECLLSQHRRKLRPGAENWLIWVTSWQELRAQLGVFWFNPDLCPLGLSTLLV